MKTVRKLIFSLIFAVLSVASIVAVTFAWLSNGTAVTGDGMNVIFDTTEYDISVMRSDKYETVKNYYKVATNNDPAEDRYNLSFSDAIEDEHGYYVKVDSNASVTISNQGYRLATNIELYDDTIKKYIITGTSTQNDTGQYCRVTNTQLATVVVKEPYDGYEGITQLKQLLEVNYAELDNESEYRGMFYLMPGSYGTLTFYLRKKDANANVSTNIKMNISGLKIVYKDDGQFSNANGNFDIEAPSDDRFRKALNMLQGHILFFENRTVSNGSVTSYSDFIENGSFNYSTEGKTQENGYYKIVIYWEWPETFEDLISEKYPSAVSTFVSNNANYIFGNDITNTQYATYIQTVSGRNRLSDGYNDGDKLIGDNVQFVIVTIE